jgi:hypothetical protein
MPVRPKEVFEASKKLLPAYMIFNLAIFFIIIAVLYLYHSNFLSLSYSVLLFNLFLIAAIFSLFAIGNFSIAFYSGFRAAKANLDLIGCGLVGSFIHIVSYAIIFVIGIILWLSIEESGINEESLQIIGVYLISGIYVAFIFALGGGIIGGAKRS